MAFAQYIIERKSGWNDWQKVATVPGGALNFTDRTTQRNTVYLYRVCGVTADGSMSPYTTEVSVRTPKR
jgi:hypothetical protein